MKKPDLNEYSFDPDHGPDCWSCQEAVRRYEEDLIYWEDQQYQIEREQESSEKFWMVVGPQNKPQVRHPTLEVAEKEAERLSQKHLGSKFFVVQTVSVVESISLTNVRVL